MKILEVPGLDRLDHSTTITKSTLRSIDGIIVAFDRNSLLSEHKAKLWVENFGGRPVSEDCSYVVPKGGGAYDTGDRLPPVKLIGHKHKSQPMLESDLVVNRNEEDGDDDDEPDIPSLADYNSRRNELHQIFESALKYQISRCQHRSSISSTSFMLDPTMHSTDLSVSKYVQTSNEAVKNSLTESQKRRLQRQKCKC